MAKEETKVEGQQQMTYEELLKAAKDLTAQNTYLKNQAQQMLQKIKELADFAMFRRLDYLFKVVELRDKFPAEFVQSCADEIVETMTPPTEEELNVEGDKEE